MYHPPGRVSSGTMIELGYLYAISKPVIVVTKVNDYINHPLINHFASWIVPVLDDAVTVCAGLREGYAE